jgi:hypothetical protein
MTPKKLLKEAGCEMKVVCGRSWDEFEKTEHDGARFCAGCEKLVFYTRTREELIIAAKNGLCVYIAPEFDNKPDLVRERIKAIEAKALANMGKLTGSVAFKRKK